MSSYIPSFRVWDKSKKEYIAINPIRFNQVCVITKDNTFSVVSLSNDIYQIESAIGKIDCTGRQIFVGDVLEKMNKRYLCSNKIDYTERINEILQKEKEIIFIESCSRPYGFPMGDEYSVVYTRTGIYSTPLDNIQGQLWLSGENAGYDGEGFENSKDWFIHPNTTIHNPDWAFLKNITEYATMNFDLSKIDEEFSVISAPYCSKCKSLENFLKTINIPYHSITENNNPEEFNFFIKKFDILSAPAIITKDLKVIVDLSDCISYCRSLIKS